MHLLVGATRTNLAAIGAFLRPYQATIVAGCGHIATHETGATEVTGYQDADGRGGRRPAHAGLIAPLLAEHGNEHMVQPLT